MVCLFSLFVSRITQKVEDDLHENLAQLIYFKFVILQTSLNSDILLDPGTRAWCGGNDQPWLGFVVSCCEC